MALTQEAFMGSYPHDELCFGLAVAAALRARYPFHTAKLIAGDLDCTVKTAENLLGGHLSAKTMTRIALVYGYDLITEALATLTGRSLRDWLIEKQERAERETRQWESERRRYMELSASLENRLS